MAELFVDFQNGRWVCEVRDGMFATAKIVEKVEITPAARGELVLPGAERHDPAESNARVLEDLFGPGRRFKSRGGRRPR